jgi:hypothetical protein
MESLVENARRAIEAGRFEEYSGRVLAGAAPWDT